MIRDKDTEPPSRLQVSALRVEVRESSVTIADEISFELGVGEILGLVGESGSGKSTIGLALLGYTRPGLTITSGSVRVNGIDLLTMAPSQLAEARGRLVAYVAQDPTAALNPTLRIGTHMTALVRSHAGPMKDEPAKRIAQVLHDVQLDPGTDVLRRYPHQLSGGQQQRLVLAMALLAKPQVVVFDEPTTGLDVTTQRRVLEMVRGLCTSYGMSGIFVSHDLAVVRELADEVMVVYAGRAVERARAADLFDKPQHPYTRRLIAAVPNHDNVGAIVGIAGEAPRPDVRSPGCAFSPRCEVSITRCEVEAPDLEPRGASLVRCHVTETETRTSLVAMQRSTRQASEAILDVADLSAVHGTKPVLADVTLSVPRGGTLAIVGESGSGKTTLARCIVGLHHGWRGDIQFNGQRLQPNSRTRSPEQQRLIQYVFQNPYASLNPRRTIGDTLARTITHYFGTSKREARVLATEALSQVSLSHRLLAHYPGSLSGGERQRVAIARALAARPDLLVCDEVTSALDVSVQATVIQLLADLQTRLDLSLIFITHNLGLLNHVADQCAVIRDGLIVEWGECAQILHNPRTAYAQTLLAAASSVSSNLKPEEMLR